MMNVIYNVDNKLNSQRIMSISILLMVQYYILWTLSYVGAFSIPVYYSVMYVSSILYLIGLLILLLRSLIRITIVAKNDHFLLITIMITGILIALSVVLSYIKYLTYNAYTWDLGIFKQVLFSTAFYHKLLYYTADLLEIPSGSILGAHFSPILFLLVPLYYLSPHALTLLAIQAILVYGAAIPLYLISKELIKDKVLSLMIALTYLITPGLSGLIYFDFHVEAFIPIIYFLFMYYFLRKKYFQSLIFLTLFLMIIEFTQIIALSMLIPIIYYIIKIDKQNISKKLMYIVFYVILITAFLLITPKIMGIFNPHKSSSIVYNPSAIAGYKGPITNIFNYIEKNTYVLFNYTAVDFNEKIYYFTTNLVPLFTSITEPILLIPAIPYIAFASLSAYPPYYQNIFQYSAYFVPQVFIAYVVSLSKIKSNKRIAAVSFIIGIICFIVANTLSPLSFPNLYIFINNLNSKYIYYLNYIKYMIPNNASILTINNLFPHYANNINAYVLPFTINVYSYRNVPSYILNINVSYILITADSLFHGNGFSGQAAAFYALSHGYGLFIDADGVYLFKYGYKGKPILTVPLRIVLSASHFFYIEGSPVSVVTNVKIPGNTAYYWPPNASGPVFWFGPYLILMPGSYKATVYLMITKPCNGTLLTLDVSNDLGSEILVSKTISCSEFPEPNKWVGFLLQFNITSPALTVEIRGLNPTGLSGIYFGYVVLNETKPYS